MAIEAAANEVINLRDSLNEWDSKVGDGDCGSTVSPVPKLSFHLDLLLGSYILFFMSIYLLLQMYRGATAILEDMKK